MSYECCPSVKRTYLLQHLASNDALQDPNVCNQCKPWKFIALILLLKPFTQLVDARKAVLSHIHLIRCEPKTQDTWPVLSEWVAFKDPLIIDIGYPSSFRSSFVIEIQIHARIVWSNYRPAGRMWPATVFSVARGSIQENVQIWNLWKNVRGYICLTELLELDKMHLCKNKEWYLLCVLFCFIYLFCDQIRTYGSLLILRWAPVCITSVFFPCHGVGCLEEYIWQNELSTWRNEFSKEKFPKLKDFAIKMHSRFGNRYLCDRTSSTMMPLNSKNRNRMADETLDHCLRAPTCHH